MRKMYVVLVAFTFAFLATHAYGMVRTQNPPKPSTQFMPAEADGLLNMLALKCKKDERFLIISRAAVLSLPHSTSHKRSQYDFAIATGHGFVDAQVQAKKDCFVSDFHGQSYEVEHIRIADNYVAGTGTDWALIAFKRIPSKHLVRYPLRLNDITPDGTVYDVQFASARGLPFNGQKCAVLTSPDHRVKKLIDGGLSFHNCHGIPGQSGSPVTRFHDGTENLIGFHLGSDFFIHSPFYDKAARHGRMRLIDADFIQSVEHYVAEFYAR